MKKIILVSILSLLGTALNATAGAAQQAASTDRLDITAITVAGGPILTRHFQSGTDNFVNHHEIGIAQVNTRGAGNWAFYYLGPNSVGKQTVGAGFVTDPWRIPMGPTALELSGALGLVSGYQNYPVPLLGVQARFDIYQSGPWNAGLEMAAMPYIARDQATDKNKFGIVGTTPFLSVRYSFQ